MDVADSGQRDVSLIVGDCKMRPASPHFAHWRLKSETGLIFLSSVEVANSGQSDLPFFNKMSQSQTGLISTWLLVVIISGELHLPVTGDWEVRLA